MLHTSISPLPGASEPDGSAAAPGQLPASWELPPGGAAAEPDTFEEFVLTQGPALLAFARRLTLDHHRAEDIVQDVLARMALSRPAVGTDLRGHAFTAVLQLFLSWRRRLSTREHPVATRRAGRGDADRGGVEGGFDDTLAERDRLRLVLADLPLAQRAVLVLRYYHDRPDSEIATMMGCREATVRSHARRGLIRLRTATTAREDLQ